MFSLAAQYDLSAQTHLQRFKKKKQKKMKIEKKK